ncbi:hypothetical protein ACJX0J_041672, partial [Zea mays]
MQYQSKCFIIHHKIHETYNIHMVIKKLMLNDLLGAKKTTLIAAIHALANGDWKTVETKFERNLCPTKRGARENRLFQITKNIGWQDGIKWLNVAIIKDLFMSKGTFQVKDGKNSTVAFVFSTDQDTFGLVIGGLG